MKSLLLPLTILLLTYSCSDVKVDQAPKYPDPFRENFAGEPERIEMLNYLVDSSGKLIPDSLHYELGEWKDKYLRSYTDRDSSGKNTVFGTYTYHPNGKLNIITVTLNGKPFERYETIIDSAGRSTASFTYDSANKLQYFYKEITEDDKGRLLTFKIFSKDSVKVGQYAVIYEGNSVLQTMYTDSSGKISTRSSAKLRNGDKIADTIVSIRNDSTSTKILQYRYDSYDSLKNWLQRTDLNSAGKPVKVVKRTITYVKNPG